MFSWLSSMDLFISLIILNASSCSYVILNASSCRWKQRHTEKHKKLWDTKLEILLDQQLIAQITMKINIWKSNSDNDLPLKKTLEFYNMIIVRRSVFQESNKYYPQVLLD